MGGVGSIIHQLTDQTARPIYLTLQGAERDLLLSALLLSWCLHLHLSLLHPSVLFSLQRMDEGEHAAKELSASITSALAGVIGEEFCE